MEPIVIEVSGNIAKVTSRPARITAGTVGQPVDFTFEGEVWDGLTKVAVFQAGIVRKNMVIADNEATVPVDVLAKPGHRLHIGVYGVAEDETIAIPTTWANLGQIVESATPGASAGYDPVSSKKYWDAAMLAADEAEGYARSAESDAGVALTAAGRAEAAAIAAEDAAARAEDAAAEGITVAKRYATIEDALYETNSNDNGNVLAYTSDDGEFNIKLLDNVESSQKIDVSRDCTIHLNGKTLRFTASGAHFNVTGISLTINGEVEGSSICKEGIVGNADTKEYLVQATGSEITVNKGRYVCSNIETTANIAAFEVESNSITMHGCTVEARNPEVVSTVEAITCSCPVKVIGCSVDVLSAKHVNGIFSRGDIDVTGSKVNVEAPMFAYGVYGGYLLMSPDPNYPMHTMTVDNSSITATSPVKKGEVYGIYCYTYNFYQDTIPFTYDRPPCTLTVNNCHVEAYGYSDTQKDDDPDPDYTAVYSIYTLPFTKAYINGGYHWGGRDGIGINGKVRIDGGVFGGPQHGGAYFSGPSAYVRNSTFCNTEPIRYFDPLENSHMGCVYCSGVEGAENSKYYFDNCRFVLAYRYVSHIIVVKRNGAQAYLSNCELIDISGKDTSGQLRADYGNTIYIGKNVIYKTITQPVDPDPDVSWFANGTIDTTTYNGQEFTFDTEEYIADFGYDSAAPIEDKLGDWVSIATFGAQAYKLVGDIDSALDSIIAIQDELIGGGEV